MSDKDVELKISADASGVEAGMQKAIDSVTQGVESIRGALQGAFELAGIAAAIDGIKKLNEALSQVSERVTQIKVGSENFGISTGQFQGLQVVAAQTGVGFQKLDTTMMSLQTKMAQAGEQGGQAAAKFAAVGISLDELRDPAFTVEDAMTQLGAASNSNAAIMAILGARGGALIPTMRALAQGHDAVSAAAAKVGALTSSEIDLFEGYHAQVDITTTAWGNFTARVLAGAVPAMEGLERSITNFIVKSGLAVAAANAIQSAIMFVGEEVIAFIGQIKDIADALGMVLNTGVAVFGGLGRAISDGLHGRFKEAANELKEIPAAITANWQTMWDSFDQNAKDAGTQLSQLDDVVRPLEEVQVSATKMSKGPQLPDLTKQFDPAAGLDKLFDQLSEQMTAKIGAAWKTIAGDAASSAEVSETAQIGSIDRQIAAVANLGKVHQISGTQELEQTVALLDAKWAEQQAYFDKLKTIYSGDAKELEKINKDEEGAYQAHLNAKQKADQTAATESLHDWQVLATSISSALDSNLKKMIAGTESFGQAMKSIFSTMAQNLISSLVKIGVQEAISRATSLTLQRTAQQQAVMVDAKKAASGAYSAIAGIPYIGPIIAPAAAAAAFAAVEAFSAFNGFDIPAGANPLTQLHEKEMVLPANIAQPMREQIASGGLGRGRGDMHVHLSSHDTKGFSRQLHNNSSQLHKALKGYLGRGGRG